MPKRVKQRDGKVVAENLTGKPVPRKGGLTDERTRAPIASRDVRRVGRGVVGFVARRGR